MEKSPDLRLGQLLINITLEKNKNSFEDHPFYYEDYLLEEQIDLWLYNQYGIVRYYKINKDNCVLGVITSTLLATLRNNFTHNELINTISLEEITKDEFNELDGY